MSNYASPLYDKHRSVIKNMKENGKEWIFIETFGKKDLVAVEAAIEMRVEEGILPDGTDVQLWNKLVKHMKEIEEKEQDIILPERITKSTLIGTGAVNDLEAPTGEKSTWILYKEKLVKGGWSEESIKELERATVEVLKKLNKDTRTLGSVKGLMVGNVQSGKTANMAALMAMAGDWGWNMFIVLSGTIDNLREQTETRLVKDLKTPGCNLAWQSIKHPNAKLGFDQKTDSLSLSNDSIERYITVCLKNKTRLQNLHAWLKQDANQLANMKIMIIDDEADQGSIDTNAANDEKERSQINKAIVRIVDIQANDGTLPTAMNYISYTATPYANFLNESGKESLYPKDFIGILNPAKEYFGPKQIFGLEENEDYRGLNIVREITIDEHKLILDLHKGEESYLPKSFEDAICWFLCAVSVMRYRKFKTPISMLIHTSQKQLHHELVNDAIRSFFKVTSKEELITQCKEVYERETQLLTTEDFDLDFEEYPLELKDYPIFEKIEKELDRLISRRPSHIQMEAEDEESKNVAPIYHEGVHICVDNCANNGINDEGEHVRLIYPKGKPGDIGYPKVAPAFILIGGSTLSRGLTIEGLVASYFLRTSSQADSLMQMGRWFGYRKVYEMLPRIWMTDDTKNKFTYLATLEEELREEIYSYAFRGAETSEYGPRVKASPKVSWMRITAKNKMNGAVTTDLDFSGSSNQTIYFDNEEQKLTHNINLTESFLSTLGEGKVTRGEQGLYWENIEFTNLYENYLSKFIFNEKSEFFKNIPAFEDWFNKVCEKTEFTGWNIVLSGKKRRENEDKVWDFSGKDLIMVNRSRKVTSHEENNVINIGALLDPNDLTSDVSKERFEKLPEDYKADLKGNQSAVIREVRSALGLDKTPTIIIYRINQDSKAQEPKRKKASDSNRTSPTRANLKAVADLIGMNIYIPGQKAGVSVAAKVAIKLNNDSVVSFDGTEGGEVE